MSLVEELKLKGNEHFKNERYKEAVDCYAEALSLQSNNHVLYSNRSACYNKLGKYEDALADASHCVSVAPMFARGHLRKATALNGLGKHEEALNVAEVGYKLRGSDRICRDCVTQWLEASTKLMKGAVAEMEDIPPGTSPVSQGSVRILSRIQSEYSSSNGLSPEVMEECVQEVVTELHVVLKRFGHSIGSCAQAWVIALTEILKVDPRTHVAPESATKLLSSKTSEFATYLSSQIDPTLYPVVCPVFALAILSILTCVSTLSRVISFRNVIQLLARSCLPFFDKSVLSGRQYIRLHIHALQLLLNSFCMESGHARQRRDEERGDVLSLSRKLEGLLKQYPSTADDYSSVTKTTLEVLENSSLLLSPAIHASPEDTKLLTADDAETVKAHVAKEEEALQLLVEASEHLNFRDMDSLILATGGLVHLGEVEKAKDTLKLSESLYFRVFTQLFESKLLSLDAEASFHPQTMIQTNALFLAGIDDMLLADLFVRWKCISSELYALLIRLGVGSRFTSTFQRLEQLKLLGQGKSGQADVLAGLADQHQKEVRKVVQEWGPKVVTALSELSCQQIQRVLDPEQIVMEYCMSALYDTKCHPVPIPPKFLAMSGVLVVIKAVGAPLVRVVDFDKIQKLALKAHDSAMKAVAAKRTRKPWHHLQSTADEVASALLEAMIPTDVQVLLATPPMKRVFFCPDQLIAKFPVEILPFGNRLRFGEKCAVSYLSSAKELLRDSILSSLCPDLVKTSDPAGSDCIFFANPNFDLKCQADAGALHPWSQLSTALASLFSKPVTASAPPLPHSETEVKEVEHLLSTAQGGKLRTQLFLKDESTLHQALQVRSPLILHFATHGFSSPEFQYQYRNFWSDTRSGLLLAGANTYRRGQFQDIASEAGTGELTALAACGMALQGTRLVYISTCRSLYGFIGRGEEALSSLAQGFRSAGAQTVLATLWPVSDDIAQKLATHFYFFASKTGVHPSIALQNAKKKIQEEGYDHWYDWAAFLCIGIDTPLFSSTV